MQLMPATARRFGVVDPFNPQQNIHGGVRYLRWLLDKFGGNQSLAAAGYNAGENAVVRYGGIPPYRETQGYVRKIMGILNGAGAEIPPVVAMASYTPGGPPVGGTAVADVDAAAARGLAVAARAAAQAHGPEEAADAVSLEGLARRAAPDRDPARRGRVRDVARLRLKPPFPAPVRGGGRAFRHSRDYFGGIVSCCPGWILSGSFSLSLLALKIFM